MAADSAMAEAAQLAAVTKVAQAENLTDLRLLNHQVCGVRKYLFTTAVLVGLRPAAHERRYCYEQDPDARAALAAWDGHDHPPGPWIKCKGTGIDLLNPEFGRD